MNRLQSCDKQQTDVNDSFTLAKKKKNVPLWCCVRESEGRLLLIVDRITSMKTKKPSLYSRRLWEIRHCQRYVGLHRQEKRQWTARRPCSLRYFRATNPLDETKAAPQEDVPALYAVLAGQSAGASLHKAD